jgi:hypothetical protein
MILPLLLFGLILVAPQEGASTPSTKCTQSFTEQQPLLREAIANRYTVGRVEFTGNETTSDYVLRRRVLLREETSLVEGTWLRVWWR